MISRHHAALFARTAVRLRPGQVTQRARLRGQRWALGRVPGARRWLLAGPDPAGAAGWPAAFAPADAALWADWPGLAALQAGHLGLLGQSRRLASPLPGSAAAVPSDPADSDAAGACWTDLDWAGADWAQPGAPLLWRFHLHYWDWAWSLVPGPGHTAPPDSREWFAALWSSWQAAVTPGQGEAWRPYPASLRAWSWCGLHRPLAAGTPVEGALVASLAAHTGFLRRHLETDVGGNHLIKNLKALAGLAVFFGDDRLLARVLRRLHRQLAVQVLADGGHYERAPAYHCQVLGDLIDVAGLLEAAGHGPAPELRHAIRRMRHWLGCVLSPAGEVPLLNDGYPVDGTLLRRLRPGPAPGDALTVLPDTGLARLASGRWQVLADIGPPCPATLPAHAHADTLSCLVYVDRVPLLVDTGTSGYAPGPARDWERSTAAHNTLTVDGADSTEVWGAFRAARRARVSGVATGDGAGLLAVEAEHDGFARRPGRPRHRRRWTLGPSGLRVDDLVTGRGQHEVTVFWHLAPGTGLRLVPGGAVAVTGAGELRIGVYGPGNLTLSAGTAPVAAGFGRTVMAPVLACRVDARLPVRLSTQWRRATQPRPSGEAAPLMTSRPRAVPGAAGAHSPRGPAPGPAGPGRPGCPAQPARIPEGAR